MVREVGIHGDDTVEVMGQGVPETRKVCATRAELCGALQQFDALVLGGHSMGAFAGAGFQRAR
jgi:hypothetical protein